MNRSVTAFGFGCVLFAGCSGGSKGPSAAVICKDIQAHEQAKNCGTPLPPSWLPLCTQLFEHELALCPAEVREYARCRITGELTCEPVSGVAISNCDDTAKEECLDEENQ